MGFTSSGARRGNGFGILSGRFDLPGPGGRGLASSPNKSSLPTRERRLWLNQPVRARPIWSGIERFLTRPLGQMGLICSHLVVGHVVNFGSRCSIVVVVEIVEIVEIDEFARGSRGWLPDGFDKEDVIPRSRCSIVVVVEIVEIVEIDEFARGSEEETQRRYDQDIDVTTISAPITTVGVFVSTAEPSTPPTTTTVIEDEDLIIAQTLMKMRSEKSKEKAKERGSKEKSGEPATRPTRGVTMQEPGESRTRKVVPPSQHDLKDKGKAKMIKPDNTQAIMEADYDLAQRLQVEEQGELTIEERSRLFVELIDKRKKHFAKLTAKKIRRKPPTKAQKRNKMSTYLRNMVVEGSEKKTKISRKEIISKKRAGKELDVESVKRQKLEDDVEKAELQLYTHFSAEDKSIYQINQADEVKKVQKFMPMLDDFDRQDVLDLYRMVKERFEIASLKGYARLLWRDLTTLFELSEEDEIWKA
ncbi:hypothetical protein Tco_0706181 [Tanacetum coccineum]|uniref:Uncharacterized protein n=1 Tax=Tanacetum coccineum TaxID=301880 RepID=A0ABQ4Y7K1_9ASTR